MLAKRLRAKVSAEGLGADMGQGAPDSRAAGRDSALVGRGWAP